MNHSILHYRARLGARIAGLAKVFLVAVATILAMIPAKGQEPEPWPLWEDDPDAGVVLDTANLAMVEAGDRFSVSLPGGEIWIAAVKRAFTFPNGDFSVQALLEDASQHSLVLTLGESSAHGSISSPNGVYQLRASLADGALRGQLRRYEPMRAPSPVDDFLDVSEVPESEEGEAPAEFLVEQVASTSPLALGGELTITLEITNQTGRVQEDLYADVFFLLENTGLLEASSACATVEASDGTPVLSCRLGRLDQGERRRLSYSVSSSQASHPLILSTVLVGESSRHDLVVGVYRDVLSDTDGDGLSDFNEGLIGSDPLVPAGLPAGRVTTIDVLPVFAAGVEEFYAGEAQTRFNQLLSMANAIYEESGVPIRLRQAGLIRSDYQSSPSLAQDLRALTYMEDPAFAELEHARIVHGGDLVVLARTMRQSDGLCGLANLVGKGLQGDFSGAYQKRFAYSVINLDCLDDSVLAHELGHNMGLVHSRLEDPDGGAFPWAAGFGRAAQSNFHGFATVMAYSGDYGTDNKVFRFSNPTMFCGPFTAFPCGQDHEDPALGADAAATLDFVRHQIAAFYPSLEQRLQNLRALEKAQPNRPSAAVILAGATDDGGFSYRQEFPADAHVDVHALLRPDPAHVGAQANLHAVFRLGTKGFFQFDQQGKLVRWEDMDFTRLEPMGGPVPLQESMRIDPLTAFQGLEQGLAGQHVAVFLAYRLVRSGTLVFGAAPLGFRFLNEPEEVVDAP